MAGTTDLNTARTRAMRALGYLLQQSGWNKTRIAREIGVGWRSIHRWSRLETLPVSVVICEKIITVAGKAQAEAEAAGVEGMTQAKAS
jgi:hypothetical protein